MEDRLIQQTIDGMNDPEEVDKEYVLKTYGELNAAAEKGYGENYYDYNFDLIPEKIRNNLLHFAGQKAYTVQTDLNEYYQDAEDEKEFRKRALQYLALQNGTYLDVQKSFASRSAQWARNFKTFWAQRDLYPNLKFRTMEDDRVRPAHAILDGIVKPVKSTYVATHATPLGYRCRCMWEQTTEDVTENSEDVEDWMPEPQFQTNTAKDGTVFNKYTSYAQIVKNDGVQKVVWDKVEEMKRDFPYRKYATINDKSIYISDFSDPNDVIDNVKAAGVIVKQLSLDVYVRPHLNMVSIEQKNPEFSIGNEETLGDLKTYDKKHDFRKFIKNSLSTSNKQGVEYLVLDVTDYIGDQRNEMIISKLNGELKNENLHKNIKNVILISNNNATIVSRKNIADGDFSMLNDL